MLLPSLRSIRAALILAVFIGATACGDSSGPSSPAGTYTLQTIDNSALPYLLPRENVTSLHRTILSWAIVLNDDKSFGETMSAEDFEGGQFVRNTITLSGIYAVTGSNLRLTYPPSGDYTEGVLKRATLTITAFGHTMVFTR